MKKIVWELEFQECESCKRKCGAAFLCRGCVNNRTVINRLREHANLKEATTPPKGCSCKSISSPEFDCIHHGR